MAIEKFYVIESALTKNRYAVCGKNWFDVVERFKSLSNENHGELCNIYNTTNIVDLRNNFKYVDYSYFRFLP